MKRIAVIVLSVILCGTILSYYFLETSGEYIIWAALPLLLVLLVIDRQKNPFSELIRPHTFFMSSIMVIICLLGIEFNQSPVFLLAVYLPGWFLIHAWREHLYDKETAKAVEKAFSEKRPEDIKQALEFLAYDDRYEKLKNGHIWYNELQKMIKE